MPTCLSNKKFFPRFSIKARILAIILAMGLLTILITGLLASSILSKDRYTVLAEAFFSELYHIDNALAETIEDAYADLAFLSREAAVRELLLEPPPGDESIARTRGSFQSYTETHREADALFLGTPDNRFYSYPESAAAAYRADFLTSPWYTAAAAAAGRPVLTGLEKNGREGRRALLVSRGLSTPQGEPAGVIGMRLPMNSIIAGLQDMRMSFEGELFIITDQAPDSPDFLRLDQQGKYHALDEAEMIPWAGKLDPKPRGMLVEKGAGGPLLIFYRYMDSTGWTLAFALSEREIMATIRDFSRVILLSLFGIICLMGGLVLLGMHRFITTPLKTFAGEVEEVRRTGDLKIRSCMYGHSELGTLAEAFNETMQELDYHRNNLEEMVIQRTRELEQAKEAAEEASRAKGDFLANMSHEIRTPMNALTGLGHLLNRTELTARQQGYVDRIRNASQSLMEIINDILDFSKIDAGKLLLEEVPFRLDDVLNNAADFTRQRIEGKPVDFLIYRDPEIPVMLTGDPVRLGQILTNLCSNAAKFTDQGEIVMTVRGVQTSDSRTQLEFAVRDTGIGMSPKQQEDLFDAFTQGDSTTTRKYGGTGLGLSISGKLLELMDSQFAVTSRPGQGSTFSFRLTLPRAEENAPPLYVSDDLKGQRALIIDDNPTSCAIFKDYMESFGFRADTAEDPELGIGLLEKEAVAGDPYHFLLLDFDLPSQSGDSLCHRIKGLRQGRPPVIIMASAYEEEEIIERSVAAGADSFLLKPVSPSLLFDTIMRSLDREAPSRRTGSASSPADPLFEDLHILLAEDNEINQLVARELLEGLGAEVDIAANGREAVAAAASGRYQTIFLDIQMPLMDGLEAARRIRSTPGGADSVIIAMTAHAMKGDREKSLRAGMNDHITKPLDPDQLGRILQKYNPEKEVPGSGFRPGEEAPSIAGLDTVAGLKRIRGNRELYSTLLEGFAREWSGSWLSSDPEERERQIHTLKGTAGNIGAAGLYSLAARYNKAETEEKEALEKMLTEETEKLAAAIREFLTTEGAEREEVLPEKEETNHEEKTEALGALKEALKQRRPRPARRALERYRQSGLSKEETKRAQEVEKLLDKYRLPEALKIVASAEERRQ